MKIKNDNPPRMLSVMYHDVVESHIHETSGFPGRWAQIYKLSPNDFGDHLKAIHRAIGNQRVGVIGGNEDGVFLTFDDGGVSAYEPTASMLEQYGWRGHFFITTNWIGRPGFLSSEQICDLDRRGHVIGSHSCSHPTRMAELPWAAMSDEWTQSVRQLSLILGHAVTVASVPGGYYSLRVAKAAAQAGIRTLFTSDPTTSMDVVDGCRVLGRYVVKQGMRPEWSGGFAANRPVPRLKQMLLWKTKGVAKRMGGRMYLQAASAVLSSRKS